MADPITLHQFRGSHFNEKIRWALAYKGVKHRRVSYLPGPHMAPIRRLSGQTATPVLAIADEAVSGTANIIEALERRFPEPRLYPEAPALREKALAIQARFDAEVGPATRTAAFTVMINELDFVARFFGGDAPWLKLTAYRAALPVIRGVMAKTNGVTDSANVARCFETIDRTLDWVEGETRFAPALAGDAFSIADLTVAALLNPIVALDHPDCAPPQPIPAAMEQLLNRWRGHPALDWVRDQYRLHRPLDATCVEA
jgi:glutathione S-transferase